MWQEIQVRVASKRTASGGNLTHRMRYGGGVQDPILVVSSDWHVLDCNQAATKMAKYSSKVTETPGFTAFNSLVPTAAGEGVEEGGLGCRTITRRRWFTLETRGYYYETCL